MTKEEFKEYYELDEKILDRLFSIGREFAKKLDISYGYSRNIHEKSGSRIELKKYSHELIELLELTDEDICDDQCVDRLIQQRQEKIDKLLKEKQQCADNIKYYQQRLNELEDK